MGDRLRIGAFQREGKEVVTVLGKQLQDNEQPQWRGLRGGAKEAFLSLGPTWAGWRVPGVVVWDLGCLKEGRGQGGDSSLMLENSTLYLFNV